MTQIATQVSRELRRIAGRRERRRARRTRDRRGPGRRRQLERGLGQHRLRRRLRRDGRVDRERGRPRAGRARSDVVTYSTQKIRDVGALEQGREPGHGRRPRRADRLRQAARRARLRPGPGRPPPPGGQGASSSCRGSTASSTRGSSCPPTQPNLEIEVDLAKARARGHQARRRAPRGGHAAAGHRGRQRVRGPEGLRGDREGHARDAPQTSRACATC